MAEGSRSARENARRRAAEHKSGNREYLRAYKLPAGVGLIKIKDVTASRFDILEYQVTADHNPWAQKGDHHFERTYFSHRIPDPTSDKGYTASVICPKKTVGKPCPICEFIEEHDSSDEVQAKIAKDAKLKERQLFNCVNLLEEAKGIQLFDYSYHTFGKKLDSELDNADDDDNFDSFPEWKGGKTLKIGWEQKSMGSVFFDASSIHFKDRAKDYKNPAVHDLDKLLVLYTYDTLKALIEGKEVEAEHDTLDATETKASNPEKEKPKPKPKAKAKKEPEPEPEPEPVDDEGTQVDADAGGVEELAGDGKCPAGGVFGRDNDKFGKACDDCAAWPDCFKAQKSF